MDDFLVVRRCETMCNLQRVVDRFTLGQGIAAHAIAQSLTFEKFRNYVRRTIVCTDVMDYENVRMVQSTSGLCFLFETSKAIFIGGECGGQNFDGDIATKLRITRTP